MGVVVAEIEAVFSRIFQVIVTVFPAAAVKRILASHICHATSSWLFGRERPVAVVLPVGIVCIYISPVDEVQFICLKMMGSIDGYYRAVNACHVFS